MPGMRRKMILREAVLQSLLNVRPLQRRHLRVEVNAGNASGAEHGFVDRRDTASLLMLLYSREFFPVWVEFHVPNSV
jgi:hypothetical protein